MIVEGVRIGKIIRRIPKVGLGRSVDEAMPAISGRELLLVQHELGRAVDADDEHRTVVVIADEREHAGRAPGEDLIIGDRLRQIFTAARKKAT